MELIHFFWLVDRKDRIALIKWAAPPFGLGISFIKDPITGHTFSVSIGNQHLMEKRMKRVFHT